MSHWIEFLGNNHPCAPKFTEKDYPDLTGKVYIVTGGPTGIGYQVTSLLLGANATVYMLARSQTKIDNAVNSLKEKHPNADLDYLVADYSDLETIKPAAQKFLDKADRLDGVIHNAGVMVPPYGSKTKQGYELQLGVNDIAPWLLQKFLDPLLIKTAKSAPANSVRVVWVTSNGAFMHPKGVINWDDINFENSKPSKMTIYGQSKAINFIQAHIWSRAHAGSGVVSVSVHPGVIKTELQRHLQGLQAKIINFFLYEPRYGAYSELYGALSPELTTEKNGAYVIPFGKIGYGHPAVAAAATGDTAERLTKYLNEQVAPFI